MRHVLLIVCIAQAGTQTLAPASTVTTTPLATQTLTPSLAQTVTLPNKFTINWDWFNTPAPATTVTQTPAATITATPAATQTFTPPMTFTVTPAPRVLNYNNGITPSPYGRLDSARKEADVKQAVDVMMGKGSPSQEGASSSGLLFGGALAMVSCLSLAAVGIIKRRDGYSQAHMEDRERLQAEEGEALE